MHAASSAALLSLVTIPSDYSMVWITSVQSLYLYISLYLSPVTGLNTAAFAW